MWSKRFLQLKYYHFNKNLNIMAIETYQDFFKENGMIEGHNHHFHRSNYIHPTCVIYPGVVMQENNYFGPYCVIGAPAEHKEGWDPQNSGRVMIGSNNKFTGHVTIDSALTSKGFTDIGDGIMMMKHTHVGHNATICNDVILSVGAIIGGHAWLCAGVNVGCGAFIHQRKVVAPYCMIGAGAMVPKHLDTEPFTIYAGVPAKNKGENEHALMVIPESMAVEICAIFKLNLTSYEQHTAK
jgi:UDP-N-acetylglucosamine acyltransferase